MFKVAEGASIACMGNIGGGTLFTILDTSVFNGRIWCLWFSCTKDLLHGCDHGLKVAYIAQFSYKMIPGSDNFYHITLS